MCSVTGAPCPYELHALRKHSEGRHGFRSRVVDIIQHGLAIINYPHFQVFRRFTYMKSMSPAP